MVKHRPLEAEDALSKESDLIICRWGIGKKRIIEMMIPNHRVKHIITRHSPGGILK